MSRTPVGVWLKLWSLSKLRKWLLEGRAPSLPRNEKHNYQARLVHSAESQYLQSIERGSGAAKTYGRSSGKANYGCREPTDGYDDRGNDIAQIKRNATVVGKF